MGANKTPFPILRADRFEFESRRSMVERMLPRHHNRPPTADQRDDRLWAVEGVLVPGREDTRRLLAVNIGDLTVPDLSRDGAVTIEGEHIAAMLVSARLGRLTAEFPDLEKLDGTEARIVLPHGAKKPLYAEGMKLMEETFASMGGVAAGQGAEVIPMPNAA
ncbi:MAG TPA: hypothetical protein VFK11_03835 [Candidatus Saccharimonadales bacterium]|nr:hypothetical protein [Candidatus Saccharimonadales bacterium]